MQASIACRLQVNQKLAELATKRIAVAFSSFQGQDEQATEITKDLRRHPVLQNKEQKAPDKPSMVTCYMRCVAPTTLHTYTNPLINYTVDLIM